MFNKKKRARENYLGFALISRVGQAIASKGNVAERDGRQAPRPDSNPYTEKMTAYDLGRMISFLSDPHRDWREWSQPTGEFVVRELLDVVLRSNNTSRDPNSDVELTQLRAQWLKHELDALNVTLTPPAARALEKSLTLTRSPDGF